MADEKQIPKYSNSNIKGVGVKSLKIGKKSSGNKEFDDIYGLCCKILDENLKRFFDKNGNVHLNRITLSKFVFDWTNESIQKIVDGGDDVELLLNAIRKSASDSLRKYVENINQSLKLSLNQSETKQHIEEYEKILYEKMKDFIVDSIQRHVDGFKAKDKIVQKISDIVQNLLKDNEKKYEEILNRDKDDGKEKVDVEQAEHALEYQRQLNSELLKQLKDDVQKRSVKQIERNHYENTSLFKAYTQTVIQNSKRHTRSVNVFRDVFIGKVKGRIRRIGNFVGISFNKIKQCAYSVKNGFDSILNIGKAYVNDVKTIGRGGFGSLFKRSVRLGFIGSAASLTVVGKTLGIVQKIGFGILKSAFKIVPAVIGGVKSTIGFVSKTVRGVFDIVTHGVVGIFNNVVKNNFLRRLVGFLKTDAGAAFLGTVAAYVNHYVVENIKRHFKSDTVFDALRNFKMQIQEIEYGGFLNKHQNLAFLMQSFYNASFELKKFLGEHDISQIPGMVIDWLKNTAGGVWKLMKFIGKILNLAVNYKYTTLALRAGSKGMKHPLLCLAALAVGFTTDMILGHVKKGEREDDDHAKTTFSLEDKVVLPRLTTDANDTNFMLTHIRNTYGDNTDQARAAAEKYIGLINEIENEEDSIQEANDILDGVEEYGIGNLEPQRLTTLFDIVRKSTALGSEEIVPGAEMLPKGFQHTSDEQKMLFLRLVLQARSDRLKTLRRQLEKYSSARKKPIEFVNELKSKNTFQSYIGSKGSHVGRQVEKLKSALENFGNGSRLEKVSGRITTEPDISDVILWKTPDEYELDISLPDDTQSTTQKEKSEYKIARFQSIATKLASEKYKVGRFRGEKFDALDAAIRKFSTQAINSDDEYVLLDNMMKGDNDMQYKAVDLFLQEEMKKWMKSHNEGVKPGHEEEKVTEDEVLQKCVVITEERFKQIEEEVKKLVDESTKKEQ